MSYPDLLPERKAIGDETFIERVLSMKNRYNPIQLYNISDKNNAEICEMVYEHEKEGCYVDKVEIEAFIERLNSSQFFDLIANEIVCYCADEFAIMNDDDWIKYPIFQTDELTSDVEITHFHKILNHFKRTKIFKGVTLSLKIDDTNGGIYTLWLIISLT